MRLDQAGHEDTMAGLLATFGERCPWLEAELEELNQWEDEGQPVQARLHREGLTTDEPVETDGGPYVVIVDGDLTTTNYIRFSTDDYTPGLVVVTGDLRANTLLFQLGARIVVQGSAEINQACFGRWGTHNAMLAVDGELKTTLLFLDSDTPAHSEQGVKAVIRAGRGWWKALEPDIEPQEEEKYFQQNILSDYGHVDIARAFAAATRGEPLLRPGVAKSFPKSREARPATSGYEQE